MTSMLYEDFLERSFAAEPVPEKEFGFYREKAEKLIETLTFGRSRDSELEELLWAHRKYLPQFEGWYKAKEAEKAAEGAKNE